MDCPQTLPTRVANDLFPSHRCSPDRRSAFTIHRLTRLLVAALLPLACTHLLAAPADAAVKATLNGRLLVIQADDAISGHSELLHFIEDRKSGKRYRVHFDSPPVGLRHGAEVTLTGSEQNGEIYAAAGSMSATGSETATTGNVPTGEQRTLVMIADFSDAAVGCSVDAIRNTMFDDPDGKSVDALYREMSLGDIYFAGNVVGPYDIGYSSTSGCDVNAWADAANAAAVADGFDPNQYNRRIYVLPKQNSCGWTGLGSIGSDPSNAWILRCDNAGVYAHELGHNVSMNHASTETSEYGDTSDPMGAAASDLKHINGPHYEQMGWRSGGQIQVASEGGTFDIAPLAQAPVDALAPQIVKVAKADSGEYYYLSYRQPIGFDANLPTSVFERLYIHRFAGNGGRTTLLRGLLAGDSFVDEVNGITITHVARTADYLTARIDMEGSCTVAAATVSASPQHQSAPAGASRDYTVSVRNNDSTVCGSSRFDLAAAAPAGGWSSSLSASQLTLMPGQSGSAVITLTSAATAAAATYNTQIDASNALDSRRDTSATASYTVEAQCEPAAPTVSISPDSQNGDPGTTLNYDLTVTNRDSAACASSTFDIALTLPSGWTGAPGTNSLTLAPSATDSVSITVRSASSASAGSYDLTAAVSDAATSVHSSNDGATYVVNASQTEDTEAPSAPTGLTAMGKRKQVNLAWGASSDNIGVTGYRVLRNGAEIATVPDTSLADRDVANGASYVYTVVAYDAAGNVSASSNSVTVTYGGGGGGGGKGGGKGKNR